MTKLLNRNDLAFIAAHTNNVYKDNFHDLVSGLTAVKFRNGSINGYSFVFNKLLYIFIAGTDDLADWSFNLNLGTEKTYGCKVHQGFYEAYYKIRQNIMELCTDVDEVIIAGHSLGGAIATLASFELSKKGKSVYCVTFGSPRVGGGKFVRQFKKLVPNSYRFVYKNDAVTRLPNVLFGYRHVPNLYQSKGKSFITYFGSVFDHSMRHYLETIRSKVWKI